MGAASSGENPSCAKGAASGRKVKHRKSRRRPSHIGVVSEPAHVKGFVTKARKLGYKVTLVNPDDNRTIRKTFDALVYRPRSASHGAIDAALAWGREVAGRVTILMAGGTSSAMKSLADSGIPPYQSVQVVEQPRKEEPLMPTQTINTPLARTIYGQLEDNAEGLLFSEILALNTNAQPKNIAKMLSALLAETKICLLGTGNSALQFYVVAEVAEDAAIPSDIYVRHVRATLGSFDWERRSADNPSQFLSTGVTGLELLAAFPYTMSRYKLWQSPRVRGRSIVKVPNSVGSPVVSDTMFRPSGLAPSPTDVDRIRAAAKVLRETDTPASYLGNVTSTTWIVFALMAAFNRATDIGEIVNESWSAAARKVFSKPLGGKNKSLSGARVAVRELRILGLAELAGKAENKRVYKVVLTSRGRYYFQHLAPPVFQGFVQQFNATNKPVKTTGTKSGLTVDGQRVLEILDGFSGAQGTQVQAVHLYLTGSKVENLGELFRNFGTHGWIEVSGANATVTPNGRELLAERLIDPSELAEAVSAVSSGSYDPFKPAAEVPAPSVPAPAPVAKPKVTTAAVDTSKGTGSSVTPGGSPTTFPLEAAETLWAWMQSQNVDWVQIDRNCKIRHPQPTPVEAPVFAPVFETA